MKSKLRYTFHPIENFGNQVMYALIAHDPGAPDSDSAFLLRSYDNVREAQRAIARFVSTGKHDGEISELDERLVSKVSKWITVPEAVRLSNEFRRPISNASIRRAASLGRIRGAKRDGRDWRFPQSTFLHWLRDPAEHKTGVKKDAST